MKLSDNPYCPICNKFISINDDCLFYYGRWNHRKCYDTKKIREFLEKGVKEGSIYSKYLLDKHKKELEESE